MQKDTSRSKKYYNALRAHLKVLGSAYVESQTGIARNTITSFVLERSKTVSEENIALLENASLIPAEIRALVDKQDEPELREVSQIGIDRMQEHPDNKKLLPPLCVADESELRMSLSAEIKPIPFEVLSDGAKCIVLDGNNRLRLLREIGYNGSLPCIVLGNVEDWPADRQRSTIQRVNLARRHLTADQKKEIARQMVARGEGIVEVAKVVGLSKTTVADSTKNVSEARQEAVSEAVGEMKKAGFSQAVIAKEIGVSQKSVSNTLSKISETGKITKPAEPEFDEETQKAIDELRAMMPMPPERPIDGEDDDEDDEFADLEPITQSPTESEKAEAIARAKAKLDENAVLARAAEKTSRQSVEEKPARVHPTEKLAEALKRIRDLEAENRDLKMVVDMKNNKLRKVEDENAALRARVAELEIAADVLEDDSEVDEDNEDNATVTMSNEDIEESASMSARRETESDPYCGGAGDDDEGGE